MRVVLDTNVLISRLLAAKSVPAQAVDLAITRHEVVVSSATMEELTDVLSRRRWDRYISLADREQFVRLLLRVATMIPVLTTVDECRDPADNHFLALAADAEAGYLVTGDADLLSMTPWRSVRIVRPAEFLALEGVE